MQAIDKFVDYVLNLSKKKYAELLLYFVSFIESIFFPIPPDVLLAPVSTSNKVLWKKYAFYTTLFSVVGGMVGYLLGYYFYEEIISWDIFNSEKINKAKIFFNQNDIAMIFLAGFTPLPYKIFTLTAGFFEINLLIFILTSFVSRGLRFFIVSFIFSRYGILIARNFKKYFEIFGLILIIIFLLYVYL